MKTLQSLINDPVVHNDIFNKKIQHTAKTYLAGEKIMQKGQHYPYFMYIISGKVRISLYEGQEVGASTDMVVDEVNTNNILGEMQLFDDKPSHYDAFAVVDTEVLEIDKKSFLSFLESDPQLGYKIAVEFIQSTVGIVAHMNKSITRLLRINIMLQTKLKIDR